MGESDGDPQPSRAARVRLIVSVIRAGLGAAAIINITASNITASMSGWTR